MCASDDVRLSVSECDTLLSKDIYEERCVYEGVVFGIMYVEVKECCFKRKKMCIGDKCGERGVRVCV